MKIELSESFVYRLENQVAYIAKDKPSVARLFKNEVLSLCKSLADSPKRHRKSIYYDDESIRDAVYKGYVIIYKIGEGSIRVFALTKWEEFT